MCNMIIIVSIEDHFLDNHVTLLHLLGIKRPYVSAAFQVVDGVNDVFFQSLYHRLLVLIDPSWLFCCYSLLGSCLVIGFWLAKSSAACSLAESVLLRESWSFVYCVVSKVTWSERAIVWISAGLLVSKWIEASTTKC